MSIPLSVETFHRLREYIFSKSGLSFSDSKKYLLESRLAPRLTAVHCPTFEEYFNYIRFDPGREKELVELLNCVTTNETFFFRDISQMDCFRRVILPQVIKNREPTQSLKIWSAGCSSGEEPFTLAMIIAEEFPTLANWKVEILATDLSEHVLRAAGKGVYGAYAVRNIPPAYLHKYFSVKEGQYQVTPGLKRLVKFTRLNLFDSLQMKSIRDVDIIFCRNVLIYFDHDVRRKIVSHFYDSLQPTGSLIIGFSESLSGVNRLFKPIPWHKTFFYTKSAEGVSPTMNDPGVKRTGGGLLQSASPSGHPVGTRPTPPLVASGVVSTSHPGTVGNTGRGWQFKGKAS